MSSMSDLTERLRASVTYQYMPMNVRKMMSEAATTLETLTQENARLREALAPFAQTTVLEPNGVIVGLERFHFDRARKALGSGDEA